MTRPQLQNAALFQVTWFACVIGGAAGTAVWGALALAALAAATLRRGTLGADLILAGAAAAVGFLLDTLWIRLGILDFAGDRVAPLWIVLMWAAVALTVHHSLSVLKARPWLGGALAGATAPLCYLGGERLGAVSVVVPVQLAVVAAVWMLLFVLTFTLVGDADGPVASEEAL